MGFLTNLRCLLATDPASRAAGRERRLFLLLDDFVQWLAAAERQPAEVRKAIEGMPSGMRGDACVAVARHQIRFSRRLIRYLIEWGGGDAALVLAKNAAITNPKHVKAVLDGCCRVANGIHEPDPFGSRVDWPAFQAVLHLLRTGRVTFPYGPIQRIRKSYVKYPAVPWMAALVLADPFTDAEILERAWRLLKNNDLLRCVRERNALLYNLVVRNTDPVRTMERWRELLDQDPAAALEAASTAPHVRAMITRDVLVDLLNHPSQEVRLRAMTMLQEFRELIGETGSRTTGIAR